MIILLYAITYELTMANGKGGSNLCHSRTEDNHGIQVNAVAFEPDVCFCFVHPKRESHS